MLEKVCIICNRKFLRKKSQIILGGGKFCSNKCRFLGRKNGKNVLCSHCGTEIYRQKKALKGSKSKEYFCSKRCQIKWIYKRFNGHPNWKGGAFAYRERLKKEKNIKIECHLCGKNDLRMLVVHHIDKDRSNNLINNLVWLCQNCHFLVHQYKQEEKKLNKKLHAKKM